MTRAVIYAGTLFLCAVATTAAQPATVAVPAASGTITIDGKLSDPGWRDAAPAQLISSEPGEQPGRGGEARIVTCGTYLCLSARLPEAGRLVAHSSGRDPKWWAEDVLIWTLRVHPEGTGRNQNLVLTANPLGAYRLSNAGGTDPVGGAERVLAAAAIGTGEWSLEVAIPVDMLAGIGYTGIERVRAARPDAPEMRWFWPAPEQRAAFRLSSSPSGAAPTFSPAPLPGNGVQRAAHRPAPELAGISDAWTEEQRQRMHATHMVADSLRLRLAEVADREKRAWQEVHSRADWDRFRDQRIMALRNWLGPFPERTPLRAAVTRRANYGHGFAIENVVYESRPNLLVTGNLYLPEKPEGKVPAIVVVHSHHAAKTQSELQDLGMTWARGGTAVLVIDQLCAGERSQSQPWPRESYFGRYALGNQLLLAGESLMKWMVWDLMRGIDLLLERPYIDAKRIVLLGAVAGGGDPAAVTAVLDPRVAAVIPFNFGEAGPEEHYTLGPRGYDFETAWPGWGEWETTRNMGRSAADQYFPWLVCAAMAPRFFLYSFEIGWPQDVEHEPAWARYKKVFEWYGARDHLAEVHGFGPFPGPGECTNVGTYVRQGIYPVLKRWLNIAEPAVEYHDPLPDSDLVALTPAIAFQRKPQAASALAASVARERLAGSRSRMASLPVEARRAALQRALREKLGDIEPRANPPVQALWTRTAGPARAEAFAIETEAGIKVPVILLKPASASPGRAPLVLAVSQVGKSRFLAERGQDVKTLLENGVAVCLADLRNTGEISATADRSPGSMELAATEMMLGRTLLGSQLKDLRTVYRYVSTRPDIDAGRIVLWGDSVAEMNSPDFEFDQSPGQVAGPFEQHQGEPNGATLALLAALYEDSVAAVAARGGLVSFLSVLEDRFSHVPQDAIVPGLLEIADVDDIVASQNSRPVLLEGLIDGRNRPVAEARLQSEFAAALKTSQQLVLRSQGPDSALPEWLISQCRRKGK
jgi:dienelactone hydrolase